MPIINIPSFDNADIEAYVALPQRGLGPSLIILHEVFGVSPYIKKVCDNYAASGFVVVCPNLYWRDIKIEDMDKLSEDSGWDAVSQLYKNYDIESGVRDTFATLAHVRKLKACVGKIGTIGYCFGSRLSYLMAARCDIDCTVSYYGVGIENYTDEVHDIRMPSMLHIGMQDKLLQETARAKIERGLARNPKIVMHTYEGSEHNFARDVDPRYNPGSAALANERTLAFLKEHLI